jgi:hypothetical protein
VLEDSRLSPEVTLTLNVEESEIRDLSFAILRTPESGEPGASATNLDLVNLRGSQVNTESGEPGNESRDLTTEEPREQNRAEVRHPLPVLRTENVGDFALNL